MHGWESLVVDLDLSSEAKGRSKEDSQKLMDEFEKGEKIVFVWPPFLQVGNLSLHPLINIHQS